MYHAIQHFQFKSTQRSQIKTKVDSFSDAASGFWAAFLHHWAAHISHIPVNECIFLLPWHKLNCASANLYARVCVCVCMCMLKNQSGKILKDSQRCVEELCKHHAKGQTGDGAYIGYDRYAEVETNKELSASIYIYINIQILMGATVSEVSLVMTAAMKGKQRLYK